MPTSSADLRSYASYLEQLDFRTERLSSLGAGFVDRVRNHGGSTYLKYLRKSDNISAFKIMISEFLAEYGSTYWGKYKRSHLKEPDISKGFLYPRDAERKDSRYVTQKTAT